MGTYMTNKEHYLKLWGKFEYGIEKNYGGTLRKFAKDYVEREPDCFYTFETFYRDIKRLRQRKDTLGNVTPLMIEKMEKYCKFLSEERLFTQELLDDEYILIE